MVRSVAVGGDDTIRLMGKDLDGDALTYTVLSLPATGKLYQLSAVYSSHGYEPKAGVQITAGGTDVTDPLGRVVYVRPSVDRELEGEWGRFTYQAKSSSATDAALSAPAGAASPTAAVGMDAVGTVVLTGPSMTITSSHFSAGADDWLIAGNRQPAASSPASHEASSRGALSHYVYATDDTLNLEGGRDKDLWMFQAPQKFLGWQGGWYGSKLEFTLSSFAGDFSAANSNAGADNTHEDLRLVELHCSSCALNTGITIAYPLSASSFSGATKTFSLELKETAGWLQDPENTLTGWEAPSKCSMIEVLSGLTSVKILGDFTSWYESVSLDDVKVVKGKAKSDIPMCAYQFGLADCEAAC